MGIVFDQTRQLFHIQGEDLSYIFGVGKMGKLIHYYWGKKLKAFGGANITPYLDRAFSPNPVPEDRTISYDTLNLEYPAFGNTDFRTPAYHMQLENGSTVTDLVYVSHQIFKGKPKLEGLPSTYIEDEEEADTLEVVCFDEGIQCRVILSYTVFNKRNVLTRSVKFINEGNQCLSLQKALSMNVDFKDAKFDLLQLSGAWGRERQIEKTGLRSGTQSIESRRGASSHQHNPFLALLRKDTSETHGEVFAFSLVYSGNFLAEVEVDQFQTTRVTMGINPFDFSWALKEGESFQTPEVVLVYSDQGLEGMSHTFHSLYQTRLARGRFRDKERPVLINNWEATYFNFNEQKLLEIARESKKLGVELFVLDDGWFGKRDNDTTSLGDWFVDRNKLPNGLETLAGKINAEGLKFGLWFEPEMVSVESELYRAHPDWCLHVPQRPRSEGRSQLVLDFSRKDVQEAIIERVSAILSITPISYVKWDMNRHMTEVGSAALPPERQRETAHRYILGVYQVMDTLTSRFPHVLFESCSGGGGRFDPGILHYMPQTWTSDNTDAISRLKIQYGTSLVYPISAMGSHVSAVPNHQVHRSASLQTRGHVAMSGNLGYELDVTKLTEKEKEEVRDQIAYYKQIRKLVQFGTFYRLLSPFEGNEAAWMFVSPAKDEAFVVFTRTLSEANDKLTVLKLSGLDPDQIYEVVGFDECYGGDELIYSGVTVPAELRGDFRSHVWHLKIK
jgi:alpha-galactosidase